MVLRLRLSLLIGLGCAAALPATASAQASCDPQANRLTCTVAPAGGPAVTLDCLVLVTEPDRLGQTDTTGCRVISGDTVAECGSQVRADITGRYERLGCEARSGSQFEECAYHSVDNAGGSQREIRCLGTEIPLQATRRAKRQRRSASSSAKRHIRSKNAR
jgi:hypothetical protein